MNLPMYRRAAEAVFVCYYLVLLLLSSPAGASGVVDANADAATSASLSDLPPFRDVVIREAGEFLTAWIFFHPAADVLQNASGEIRTAPYLHRRGGEASSVLLVDELPLKNWLAAFEMAASASQQNRWFSKPKTNSANNGGGSSPRDVNGKARAPPSTTLLGAAGAVGSLSKGKGPSLRRPAALQTLRREIDFVRRTAAEVLLRIETMRLERLSILGKEHDDASYRVGEQKLVRGVLAELFSNIQLAVDTAMPRSVLVSALKTGRERLYGWKVQHLLSASSSSQRSRLSTFNDATLDDSVRRNATNFVTQYVDHCVAQLTGSPESEREEHISGPRAPTVFFTTAAKLLLLAVTPPEFLLSLSATTTADNGDSSLRPLLERYFRTCTAPIADGGFLEQVLNLRVPGEATFVSLRPVNGRFWFSIRPEVSCYDYAKYCSPFLEERVAWLEPFSLRCTQMCNWNYWMGRNSATLTRVAGGEESEDEREGLSQPNGGRESRNGRQLVTWTRVLVQMPKPAGADRRRSTVPQVLTSTKVKQAGGNNTNRAPASPYSTSKGMNRSKVEVSALRVVEIAAVNFVALGHFLVDDLIQRRKGGGGGQSTTAGNPRPSPPPLLAGQLLEGADVLIVELDRAGPKATADNVWWAMWFHLLMQRAYGLVLTERLDAYSRTSARLVYFSHRAFVQGEVWQRRRFASS